jgi:heptosyltransferase-2
LKILIEIPTWLGDAIMVTPAIANITKIDKNIEICLVGSPVSIQTLKNSNCVISAIEDKTKNRFFRLFAIYKLAKSLGKFDIALSFRSSLYSKILIWFIDSKKRFYMKKSQESHQVIKYNNFINQIFKTDLKPSSLQLNFKPNKYKNKTLGINPGAMYGSAKKWHENGFAEVAIGLSSEYDIIIFGGSSDVKVADSIYNILVKSGVNNCLNLAGKTDVASLIKSIAGLSLFVTNDSGPMHIAAAYGIKTVVIFGPTDEFETNGWQNTNELIVTNSNIDCRPCKKRVCPLIHHDCMKLITSQMVLNKIKEFDV